LLLRSSVGTLATTGVKRWYWWKWVLLLAGRRLVFVGILVNTGFFGWPKNISVKAVHFLYGDIISVTEMHEASDSVKFED
jgi:hypothetical protein